MTTAKTYSSDSVGVADGDAYRGERIGKYEVLTQLSVGGMAELFLCFTSGPGGFRKYVVVKRILPDVKSDEHFVKMFLDEARITAAFNHSNIGQVFDLGEEDGLYLAMEFIAGQNLNQITSAARKARQTLPVGFCTAVARDTALALHYAHNFTSPTGRKLPVIHRDVAQKNVMVTFDGVTKLLDFGIAKAKGSLGRTHVGMVKGTTGYMSPEQVQGLALDGRSDLFSVGVMLFELLTGRRLFAGETEEDEMRKILSAPIPKPRSFEPSISQALEDVVLKALARERADRYASGKELARALEIAMGPELYDAEHSGAFMRGLFEEKMLATRALLESADADDEAFARSGVVKSVVSSLRAEPTPEAEPPPTVLKPASAEDTLRPGKKPKPGAPAASERGENPFDHDRTLLRPPEMDGPTDPPRAIPAFVAAKAPARKPTNPPFPAVAAASLRPLAPSLPELASISRPRAFPWAVAAALAGALVFGMVMMWAFYGRNLKPSDGLDVPRALTAPTPVIKPAPNATPIPSLKSSKTPANAAAEGPTDSVQPPEKVVRGKGTLSLVTLPEATVFRGRQSLGKTPLVNVSLPAGTQTLKLKGPDGKWHVLSIPVRAGHNVAFRFELSSLPGL